MCDFVFANENNYNKNQLCKNNLNGLLNQGISNAF